MWRIWFDLGATQQYYPILHTAFWSEHRLWGDSVFGYHLTNVVLHSLSAFLVILILRRLKIAGAWLAGFTFALHPVCVEAVAWISEQKSTLSGFFYLASLFVYLRFDEKRTGSRYTFAIGLFALALLSKTVTATLPAAILVILWWKHGRLSWRRDVVPLVPMFILGLSAGLFTAWVEKYYVGANGAEWSLIFLQRCLLAGRAVWFYLSKAIWPVHLTFTYPRWNVDPNLRWQYLFPAGVLVMLAFLAFLSRRYRSPLAVFLFFAGTLFPVLGFFNVFPFIYSYVADHFQYLACLGLIVPVVSWLTLAADKIAISKTGRTAASAALVVVLGILTARQSGMYRSNEALFTETIARNPNSWMAHNNLANIWSTEAGRHGARDCRI